MNKKTWREHLDSAFPCNEIYQNYKKHKANVQEALTAQQIQDIAIAAVPEILEKEIHNIFKD